MPRAPPYPSIALAAAVGITCKSCACSRPPRWFESTAGDAPTPALLLAPVLQLFRPQLENRLAEACLATSAGTDPELRRVLQDPCQKIAGPTSRCLIEETDSSGRGLEVMREMMGGRLGDASEVVVKRCLARLLGLPADSLREVPLRELGRRLAPRQATPEAGGSLPPARP